MISNSFLRWSVYLVAVLATVGILGDRVADATGSTITIGAASGGCGALVSFAVSFQTPLPSAAALQVDVTFNSANTPIAAKTNGAPNCIRSATLTNLNKGLRLSFLPHGCSGSACSGARIVVSDNGDGTLIPNGSTLLSCAVQIASAAPPGIYPLVGSNILVSSQNGSSVPTNAINGQVTVNS